MAKKKEEPVEVITDKIHVRFVQGISKQNNKFVHEAFDIKNPTSRYGRFLYDQTVYGFGPDVGTFFKPEVLTEIMEYLQSINEGLK